jgi:hypothetical protein
MFQVLIRQVGAQLSVPAFATQPEIYLPLAADTQNLGTVAAVVVTGGSVPFQSVNGRKAAYFSNNIANYLTVPYSLNPPSSPSQVTLSYWFVVT